MDAADPSAEIKLYINSMAGSSYAVSGVIDVLRALRAPVSTVGMGATGGAMTVLLACGNPGRRFATSNARIQLAQQHGGAMGSSIEVNIQIAELNRTMYMMYTCVG